MPQKTHAEYVRDLNTAHHTGVPDDIYQLYDRNADINKAVAAVRSAADLQLIFSILNSKQRYGDFAIVLEAIRDRIPSLVISVESFYRLVSELRPKDNYTRQPQERERVYQEVCRLAAPAIPSLVKTNKKDAGLFINLSGPGLSSDTKFMPAESAAIYDVMRGRAPELWADAANHGLNFGGSQYPVTAMALFDRTTQPMFMRDVELRERLFKEAAPKFAGWVNSADDFVQLQRACQRENKKYEEAITRVGNKLYTLPKSVDEFLKLYSKIQPKRFQKHLAQNVDASRFCNSADNVVQLLKGINVLDIDAMMQNRNLIKNDAALAKIINAISGLPDQNIRTEVYKHIDLNQLGINDMKQFTHMIEKIDDRDIRRELCTAIQAQIPMPNSLSEFTALVDQINPYVKKRNSTMTRTQQTRSPLPPGNVYDPVLTNQMLTNLVIAIGNDDKQFNALLTDRISPNDDACKLNLIRFIVRLAAVDDTQFYQKFGAKYNPSLFSRKSGKSRSRLIDDVINDAIAKPTSRTAKALQEVIQEGARQLQQRVGMGGPS